MLERCAPDAGIDKGKGAAVRVLLADDDAGIRRTLTVIVAGAGDIEVVGEAANELEAFELCRRLRPDVVVMDLSMPVMDGIETTTRIAAELPEVRVIALSMYDDPYHAARMRKAGARAFLGKTGPPEELIAAIRNRWVAIRQG